MFAISLSDLDESKRCEVMLHNNPLLHEYVDIFLDEILGILLEHDIVFCIDFILGQMLVLRFQS